MWLNTWRKNVKYDRFVAIRCVFSSSKYSKTRYLPGLLPGPRRGAYDAPPEASSQLWRVTSSPHTLPPRSRILRRLGCQPLTQILGYAYDVPMWYSYLISRTRRLSDRIMVRSVVYSLAVITYKTISTEPPSYLPSRARPLQASDKLLLSVLPTALTMSMNEAFGVLSAPSMLNPLSL